MSTDVDACVDIYRTRSTWKCMCLCVDVGTYVYIYVHLYAGQEARGHAQETAPHEHRQRADGSEAVCPPKV